jgi:hypothetical protein
MDKIFDAILKLKEVELELHRLKNVLKIMNRAYDAKKEWVGLTDEEKKAIYQEATNEDWTDLEVINTAEAKLKEKNA